jgi:hypothetical protein
VFDRIALIEADIPLRKRSPSQVRFKQGKRILGQSGKEPIARRISGYGLTCRQGYHVANHQKPPPKPAAERNCSPRAP